MALNVLSLCDGMSCGQIALKKLGIDVNSYYASEIDKNAIKVTQDNFPKTIQIGDITNINECTLQKMPKIDLILAGTPCRDLSKSTTNGGSPNFKNIHSVGKGVNGKHSSLFFNFVDILKWIKENNNQNVKFLFENVTMREEDETVITGLLGVNPILINSNRFSAQNRERLYWCNFNIEPPTQTNDLVLKDILDDTVDDKYFYNDRGFEFLGEDKSVCAMLIQNSHDMGKRVTSKYFKSPTLTSCRGGNLQKKVYLDGRCRKLTPNEYRRLQTIPEWYKMDVANSHIYNMCGDGWTVDVIAYILSFINDK